MQFIYPYGATPLNNDEIYNLVPNHLSTQSELNEWEQYNIILGEEWALKQRKRDIFSIEFTQKLHQKMFNKTWKWAGKFRQRDTNIGINPIYIRQELAILFDNTKYQLSHNIYGLKEIAARLHHRLVFVHPFPNGNGRFSRLFADLFLLNNNEARFSWGRENLVEDNSVRKLYIEALQAADNNNFSKLIAFVSS